MRRWHGAGCAAVVRLTSRDANTLAAINYRLKEDDITYIFGHADVEAIIVDREFVGLLNGFRQANPTVPLIIDEDAGSVGALDDIITQGLQLDAAQGAHGWAGLQAQAPDERDLIALSYTSGTTAKPKGVEYTHRGAYLAALGNVIESGLNYHTGRCRYLWTLPQFHACGWTFPWAVTAVRGTHYCLRKIDYPEIWRLLKDEGITHLNAAPTVMTLLCSAKEAERLSQGVRVTVAASPPTAFLFEQMTNLNLHPVHVYGMTETYGPITKGYHMPEWEQIPKDEKYARMARQGHGFITSLPVRVIKADLPEGVIEDVAKDGKEIGEIVFLGNICARGYYKNPEATRKLFAGGVLHSGDLAVWHPDGAIQILDRAKDIIISGTSFCPRSSSSPNHITQVAKTSPLSPSSPSSSRIPTSSRRPSSPSRTSSGASDPRLSSRSRRTSRSRATPSCSGRATTARFRALRCPARLR